MTMPNIQQAIEHAASRFALEVVSILRGATLSELQALSGRPQAQAAVAAPPRGGRAGRGVRGAAASSAQATRAVARGGRGRGSRKRSPQEVASLAERVLEFIKNARQEVGVSAIAGGLKVSKDDLSLPLNRLRDAGKVKTHGRKRSTVYRAV
jgi:DNA-binding transcriptional ArsR family regulator